MYLAGLKNKERNKDSSFGASNIVPPLISSQVPEKHEGNTPGRQPTWEPTQRGRG